MNKTMNLVDRCSSEVRRLELGEEDCREKMTDLIFFNFFIILNI